MNKRIISSFLSAVLLTAFVFSCLSGCSASAEKKNYTVLEWLDKVEETFNLLYYTEEEPLVESVKTSDDSFETVQIAAEWGIIDPEDDLKFSGKLTKEFAADTLVRAMNCVTPSTADISDSKKVKDLYLENVMSSVNEGIFSLDSGKFNPKKKLSVQEADEAMLTAYDKWVNFSYGESYDRSTVNENVINLGGVLSENSTVVPAKYSVKYTDSSSLFDANGNYADNSNKTITFQSGQAPEGLKVDSVLAMPADDVIPLNYAVVVTNIKTNSDGSVTVSTRNAKLEEVYDEIDIQQSGAVDFSDAIFYGPDGKRLTFNSPTSAPMSDMSDMSDMSGMAYMSERIDDGGFTTLASPPYDDGTMLEMAKKMSSTFKLGDSFSAKIYTSIESNGGGFGFEITGKAEEDDEELKVKVGFDDEIRVENHVKTHWEWFKLKVDELKFSLTDTKTETFEYEHSAGKNFGKTINKVGDSNGDGKKDIGDWAKEAHKLRKIYGDTRTVGESFKDLAKKAKDDSNYKLVDIFIPSANLHFVIRAELTVEGSLKLTLTQSNTSGVELMNGKLRPIKESSNSQRLDYSAKIELTCRLALEFQLIGINIADLGFSAGVGAKVSSIIYSFDKSTDSLLEVCGIEGAAVFPGSQINAGEGMCVAENGLQLPTDDTRTTKICAEFALYPIVTVFACSSSSVVGSLFGSIELEVFNDDTPLLSVHGEIDENGSGIVSECTISANANYGITTGDKLTLNADEYAVAVSEEGDTGLAIATLPKKVTIKDVEISSDNPDVLEVEDLFHKITTPSSLRPALKLNMSKMGSAKPSKNVKVEAKETASYNFGTWFYEEASDSKNPQFVLTGKKNGTANVTITAGKESVTIPVKVGTGIEEVESVGALTAKKGTFTIAPGETAQTAFEFIPKGKTIADISFTSANNSVATVSKGGLIKAVGMGDTVITASLRANGEDYTATFTVHVVGQTNVA